MSALSTSLTEAVQGLGLSEADVARAVHIADRTAQLLIRYQTGVMTPAELDEFATLKAAGLNLVAAAETTVWGTIAMTAEQFLTRMIVTALGVT